MPVMRLAGGLDPFQTWLMRDNCSAPNCGCEFTCYSDRSTPRRDRVRRREFITLAGMTMTWPLVTRAQQATAPVVGYLDTSSASSTAHLMAEFLRGLREAGYIEGQNVAIEYRWAEGDHDKLPDFAAEFVRRQVAVIAAINTPSVLAAKAATQTIPVVFGTGIDPVKFGLVASLNRPGGNLTGVTQLNNEMEAKRVQMLHELAPAATTIAMLVNPTNPSYSEEATEVGAKCGPRSWRALADPEC